MAQCQAANKGLEESETTYTYLQAYKIFSLLLGGLNRLQSIFEAIEIPVFQLYCVLIPLLKSYIWWHVIDSGKHSQKENNKMRKRKRKENEPAA